MKISYRWLREWLPQSFDTAPEDLARQMLLLGFEVSDIQKRGPGFSGVVVGEVISVQKHPNADRLSLCSVTNGKETLSIVCGAKNVAAGARVAVAQIGAVLPGGRRIERSKIRGQESQGMICSASELGIFAGADKNGEGIMILPSEAALGEDAARIFGESDWIMEVEVTPNRPDCLSHFGLARELAVHFGLALPSLPGGPGAVPAADPNLRARRIEIEAPEACRRYIGREFQDLAVGPSPAWLVRRLEAVGLRSINNLVDVTNYVLFDLGQPLHAFDADKLRGDFIAARRARPGESLRALDGNSYALASGDLVIADASGPVAIAGIIGGEPSSVTDKTQNAFLESACFQAATVRRTSQRLRLRTDSSYRFERGTDPVTAAAAADKATELILKLCRGKAGAPGDEYPEKQKIRPIEISSERINRILGTEFAPERIEAVLRRISPDMSKIGGDFSFAPPHYRLDLQGPQDLAEEIARHLGYDNIPAAASPAPIQQPKSLPLVVETARLQDRLRSLGFHEAFSLDFTSKDQLARCGLDPEKEGCIAVLNPLSEEYAYLRPTLLVGLLQSAAYNLSRGVKNLRLFEVGRCYSAAGGKISERTGLAGLLIGDFPRKPHWRARAAASDFYDAKGAVEDVLSGANIAWGDAAGEGNVFFHPRASLQIALEGRRLGLVGLLHPQLARAWDLAGVPAAAFIIEDLEMLAARPRPARKMDPLSPFPSIARDLSVIVDADVPYAQFREALAPLEKGDNLSALDLIDIYTGTGVPPGKKSLTLRLTFTRMDRTLRDEEAAGAVEKAMGILSERFQARPRA